MWVRWTPSNWRSAAPGVFRLRRGRDIPLRVRPICPGVPPASAHGRGGRSRMERRTVRAGIAGWPRMRARGCHDRQRELDSDRDSVLETMPGASSHAVGITADVRWLRHLVPTRNPPPATASSTFHRRRMLGQRRRAGCAGAAAQSGDPIVFPAGVRRLLSSGGRAPAGRRRRDDTTMLRGELGFIRHQQPDLQRAARVLRGAFRRQQRRLPPARFDAHRDQPRPPLGRQLVQNKLADSLFTMAV